jgi:hypothetical protein
MKTFARLLFLTTCMGFVFACSKTDEFVEEMPGAQLKSAKLNTVSLPFEVNLLGQITSLDFEAQDCIDEGYPVHVIVEATGNATHMGKVSLTFNFCTAGIPDSNIEGAKYTFASSTADLIAANGDVLHLLSDEGIVMNGRTDEHTDDVVEYWTTPISILGGTGRFEGAMGDLLQDGYVTMDEQTHHRFYGEITLVKGKGKGKAKKHRR